MTLLMYVVSETLQSHNIHNSWSSRQMTGESIKSSGATGSVSMHLPGRPSVIFQLKAVDSILESVSINNTVFLPKAATQF